MTRAKISIITVCFNSENFIEFAIQSVLNQTNNNIEYIIIDGGSTDKTLSIINKYRDKISTIISEPDNGIYAAMNKGIKLATGDIIGILNSDDYFCNSNIISTVVDTFGKEDIDIIYGDVQFVDSGNINKVTRYYSSKRFKLGKFKYGFMPAHPSFYARRELFEIYGSYKEDYKISADFELLIRFLYSYKLKYKYIEMPFVSMRTGGISNKSIKSKLILNREILRACKENGINTNIMNVYSKYLFKVFELFSNKH